MSREIALLTNPTAGKGRGRKARDAALARLRERRLRRTRPRGPRRRRGSRPGPASRWPTGVDALVVCGGDGMVHLGVQAVAGTDTPLGIIPAGTGNDVARYLDLPRKDPPTAAERVIAGTTRTVDLARSGDRYFVTVLAAGFDAVVNERANRMTWPRGQMRYNLATLAELRTFQPLPYTLELDGTVMHRSTRCWSRSATVRRSAAGCGSPRVRCSTTACSTWSSSSRSASPTWCAPTRSCSRAPTPCIRSTSTTGSAQVTVAAPGIVGVRRRRAVRPAAADHRVRAGGAEVLA